jgi:lipid-A-disaccharide synthase
VSVIQDFIKNSPSPLPQINEKPVLAILPGSRKQEIKKMLPELVAGAMNFCEEYRLCIAMAPNIEKSFYHDLISKLKDKLEFIDKGTYHLLAKAELALVTSGTATLETALFHVPQVVCYKTSTINYEIGKRLVDLEYISLVNLISGKQIVPELIQNEVNTTRIVEALNEVRNNANQIIDDYKNLSKLLSIEEPPHKKAAEIIVEMI